MAFPVESYNDANQVRWRIIWTGAKGQVFASMDEDGPRVYVPPPDDIPPIPVPSDDVEVQRARFVMLREQIDEYAADHKKNVALAVRAETPSSNGLLWILLLLAIAAD